METRLESDSRSRDLEEEEEEGEEEEENEDEEGGTCEMEEQSVSWQKELDEG